MRPFFAPVLRCRFSSRHKHISAIECTQEESDQRSRDAVVPLSLCRLNGEHGGA